MASTPQIGQALRELRRRQRYSLHEVAEATGISRSFLSLVENGRSDITIGRLLRLVNFYRAQISDLLPQGDPQDPVVVRRGEQQEVRSPAEGIRISLLAPQIERVMAPTLGEVEPTGASAEYASHPGEEFIYVLDGSISLEFVDSDPIVLHEGDSAYFVSERPHSYRNEGDELARFLSVSTPPT